MARYYRKRRRTYKKNKWNIEQRASNSIANAWQTIASAGSFNKQILVPVVPATATEGVRKVKNISISAAMQYGGPSGTNTSAYGPIYWALIYAPEGVTINELKTDGELYQPSNYVINSGIIDNQNTAKYRISSRLARNLKANDRIYLLMGTNIPTNGTDLPGISWLVRYAICFN